MRQIRPRATYPRSLPGPLPAVTVAPTAVEATAITVDLRDHQARHPSYTDEERIRRRLVNVRAAVETVMEQLSELVDERENLKAQLGALIARSESTSSQDDHSVVAWGFYDDDL
jgi:hypothetical protein